MAIKYYLQPNPITPDPNDLSARVVSNQVYDLESITKEMLKRGTPPTRPSIRYYWASAMPQARAHKVEQTQNKKPRKVKNCEVFFYLS